MLDEFKDVGECGNHGKQRNLTADDTVSIGAGIILRVEIQEKRISSVEGIENVNMEALIDFRAGLGISQPEI